MKKKVFAISSLGLILTLSCVSQAKVIDDIVIGSVDEYAAVDASGKSVLTALFTRPLKVNENVHLRLSFPEDRRQPIKDQLPFLLRFRGAVICDGMKSAITFQNGGRKHVELELPASATQCQLEFWEQLDSKKKGKLRLIADEVRFPILKDLKYRKNICQFDLSSDRLTALDKVFFSNNFESYSCPERIQDLESLLSPEDGVNAKVEALLGKKLTDQQIYSQNPYMPLDFKNAPKLKMIFLSSLVFRSDFYGTLMTRLLDYHAKQGTLVYIITTEYMQSAKDKKLLYDLVRRNGNIRLQEYVFNDSLGSFLNLERKIDVKYRDMHIKFFATLGDADQTSHVVIGGRNIHDGFVFPEAPNYRGRPELTQYKVEEDFIHWTDFEVKIKNKGLAETLIAQSLTFWNRNQLNQKFESQNILKRDSLFTDTSEYVNSERPVVRQFITLPEPDHRALERYYAQLIDAAKSEILISSPYLRPTPLVSEALRRAIQRGVQVVIQTRINLKGDTMDWLYSEANKESINSFYKTAAIYEWMENSILHSKFMIVDRQVTFMGSVNLSRRSFIQDAENSLVIRDAAFAQRMAEMLEGYVQKSRRISKDEERKFFPSLLINLLENQF